ncbi:MAG: hypothetical protein IJJ41_06265 [Clostridia bacterium]|nr:hypothetical protein [Clostridia bacterium]
MKKLIAIMLVCLCALSALAGCSNKENNTDASKDIDAAVATLKTLDDIIRLESAQREQTATVNDSIYLYVFSYHDNYYRARATIPADMQAQIDKLDITKEDYTQKELEVLKSLPIAKMENLSANIPAQEEIDKFIGETGTELLNQGWSVSVSDANALQFTMNYRDYAYDVVFEGKVADPENFNEEKDMQNLTAKSFTYSGIGDATNIDV